jgi:hypothetical protein
MDASASWNTKCTAPLYTCTLQLHGFNCRSFVTNTTTVARHSIELSNAIVIIGFNCGVRYVHMYLYRKLFKPKFCTLCTWYFVTKSDWITTWVVWDSWGHLYLQNISLSLPANCCTWSESQPFVVEIADVAWSAKNGRSRARVQRTQRYHLRIFLVRYLRS